MGRMISKTEAKELLSKNPHHYLWDKDWEDWTQEDIDSLKTEITMPTKRVATIGFQPVIATLKDGSTLEFKSISEASRYFKIHETTIGSNLRGRQKTAKGIKFEKIV
tara:strand:- start:2007 stop:2327 length:321 start_codon:yes stop_codon:yes gene_type:complete